MKVSNLVASNIWATTAVLVFVACQSHSGQELVVNKDANTPTATATNTAAQPDASQAVHPPTASAGTATIGNLDVSAWKGDTDQIPSRDGRWTVTDVGGGTSSTPPPPSSGSGSTTTTSTNDDAAIAVVQRDCASGSCHGGTPPRMTNKQLIETLKSTIVGKVNGSGGGSPMPPSGPVSDADKQVLVAWANGTLGATSGGSAPPPPSGSTAATTGTQDGDRQSAFFTGQRCVPTSQNQDKRTVWTVTLTADPDPNADPSQVGYLNAQAITGAKVGQVLRIVNNRPGGATFEPHADPGAPYQHGDDSNTIGAQAPNNSIDCPLTAPYSPSSQGLYEHTDGTPNLNRQINITVTGS